MHLFSAALKHPVAVGCSISTPEMGTPTAKQRRLHGRCAAFEIHSALLNLGEELVAQDVSNTVYSFCNGQLHRSHKQKGKQAVM